MKPGWLALTIERGANWSLRLAWRNPDGTPVDLTGCTATLYIWRDGAQGAPALATVIGVLGGAAGTLEFGLSAAAIEAIPLRQGVHAVIVEHPVDGPIRLLDGPVDFLAPNQRPPRRAAGAYPSLPGGEAGAAVVVSDTETRVVSVAMQGPAGPSGGAGGEGTVSHPAGQALGGHRMVVLQAGAAVYADADTVAHAGLVLGMTTGAAAPGEAATVRTGGELTEPSWAWTADQPLYLRNAGQIGHTPPASGFVLPVGFALSPTTIFLAVGTAVLLH